MVLHGFAWLQLPGAVATWTVLSFVHMVSYLYVQEQLLSTISLMLYHVRQVFWPSLSFFLRLANVIYSFLVLSR